MELTVLSGITHGHESLGCLQIRWAKGGFTAFRRGLQKVFLGVLVAAHTEFGIYNYPLKTFEEKVTFLRSLKSVYLKIMLI